MTDDLLPAELALPAGAAEPITPEMLDYVAQGGVAPLPDLYDAGEAEWVMRRLAGLMRYITAQRAQADAWKERVDDWYAETAGPAERRGAYLEATLERYAIVERLRNPRQKSVKVPSGEVWTRENKEPRVVIDDEKELLGYLASALDPEQYDAVVRTTQKVLVSELAKVVQVIERTQPAPPAWEGYAAVERELVVLYGGERVPGVHAEPPTTSSGVRPNYDGPALTE